jgi:hypothetical protein
VDIELPDDNGWRVVKSIRDANDRKIVAKLDAPVKANRVRVKILRELYQGKDRPYADVESIRVLDSAGLNRAGGKFEPVRVVGSQIELALPPSAIAVDPTTAEVLARFDNVDKSPAILRNRFGQGQTWLVTANTAGGDLALWTALRQLALGGPMYVVSAEDAQRFRFILTRVADAHVLHVIDAAVPATNYRPQQMEISLAAQRLGRVRQAMLVGSDKALALSETDGRICFTVQPDPVATVVLKGAKR